MVIENEQLASYLMFKLDKAENEFTKEELETIDEIVLDAMDIDGKYYDVNLEILQYFKGLKKIFLKNMFLSEKDIIILLDLKLLKSVYFEKCIFENANKILNLNLDNLELINCDITDYSFLYEMKNIVFLTVISGDIDLSEINKLKKLKYLQLSYSDIKNIVPLDLPVLEEFYIENTDIKDLSIIKNIKSLNKIIISENQYIENKNLIEKYKNDGVKFLDENMVEFDVGGNKND